MQRWTRFHESPLTRDKVNIFFLLLKFTFLLLHIKVKKKKKVIK